MAICGIVNSDGLPATTERLEGMLTAMGPCRNHSSHGVGGRGRMAAGSFSRSTSVHCGDGLVVACDAEIYNQKEVEASISSSGLSTSTAALMAQLYLRDGEKLFQALDGVFSIAIWDESARRLLLARDHLGVKPLCYAELPSTVIFSSHPGAILKSGLLARKVDLRSIVDYLNFHVVPAPRSAYEGIVKVKPGHCVLWESGRIRTTQYWQLRYTEDARGSERHLAEELFSRLHDSVRTTASDLEPNRSGCFLSGGTDSSSIAGLFSQINQSPASAFSIGFAEKRFDELSYARLAAQHFKLRHFERLLSPQETYDLIPRIVELFDEPFANASAIPTYACLELAKRHGVSVMLGGDGGDELFGGNERYRVHQVYELYQRVPRILRKPTELALSAAPKGWRLTDKAKAYIRRSSEPNPDRYCRWRLLQVFSPSDVLGDVMPRLNGNSLDTVRALHRAAPAQSELNRLLHIDIHMNLADEDIPKVVRTAECNGINVRFPYLRYKLAEFSGQLPAHLKLKGLEKRYLFKRATRGFLPAEILKKKKHGFGLPIGLWLKTDARLRQMARDILLSAAAYQRGYFRKQFIETLIAKLEQDNTPYYGDLLWVFLMLEMWHRKHVAGVAL